MGNQCCRTSSHRPCLHQIHRQLSSRFSKAQAPKREVKHIELTKVQYEEMLALCKAGKDIDLTAFGITPPKPISVSATVSASFKHVIQHPIIHKIIPAPIAC